MTADTRLSSPDEPETILGPWGVLDQASAVQTPLRDPMRAYLDGLTSAASQASARARLRAVARLVAVPAYEALLWGQLRAHHVAFIRSKLVTAEAAPATVNLTLAVLRGIARQARDFNLMTDEEYRRITEVKPYKGSRLPPGRHVRSGELTALVEACARDKTPAGARDAAMLACLYVGGLRRAELAALKVEHYVPDPPTLTVKSGKGDKDRVVPLEPSAAVVVDAWLRVRGARPGRLFLPVNKGGRIRGAGITAGAVYNALARRAAEAKIAHASPHDLRRSFVSDLLEAQVDISTVQQLAGHANVTTTARYDRRGEASKRKAVEKLHFPTPQRDR